MGFVLAALALWGVPDAEIPQWDVPEVCPEQGAVEAWIDRLMLDAAGDVPKWQGHIEGAEEAGFVLTLTVSGQTRTVEAPDCGKLVVAAALVVAVAADPVAVADVIEPQLQRPLLAPLPLERTSVVEPPAPSLGPAEPQERVPTTRDPPERGPASGVSVVVSGVVGAELAVLPRAGFAASVGGGVLWSWLRLELVSVVSTPRDVRSSEPSFGATAAVVGAQVRACGVVDTERVEVPLCLAGEGGGVWARGFGPSIEPESRMQPWAALVPSLAITRWVSKRVGVEARIAVPVGLYKPAVHLSGVELDVFRAGPVGARVWVGPVLRFP